MVATIQAALADSGQAVSEDRGGQAKAGDNGRRLAAANKISDLTTQAAAMDGSVSRARRPRDRPKPAAYRGAYAQSAGSQPDWSQGHRRGRPRTVTAARTVGRRHVGAGAAEQWTAAEPTRRVVKRVPQLLRSAGVLHLPESGGDLPPRAARETRRTAQAALRLPAMISSASAMTASRLCQPSRVASSGDEARRRSPRRGWRSAQRRQPPRRTGQARAGARCHPWMRCREGRGDREGNCTERSRARV